jgi:hypothetical protein
MHAARTLLLVFSIQLLLSQHQHWLLAAPSPAPDPPKLATLQIDSGSVWGEGIWRPDNPTKKNEIIEAVTHYQCNRTGGQQLTGTEAWCLEATANNASGMLNVGIQWFKVEAWNDNQIIAVNDDPICLTQQVIFDVKRKTAISLDVRKPEARGFADVCKLQPDRQTYYLQDKADYYTRKLMNKQ